MIGLGWKYEELRKTIPILTFNSSLPANAADINPIIKNLLSACSDSSICGIGGHSVLLSINDEIVAKISLKASGEHISHGKLSLSCLMEDHART
jgi:hypothetical protein